MSLASIRPRVAEMRFQLLGRAVHPELFQIYKCQRLQREHYRAQFCITSDGHYITWQSGQATLTEVIAANTQELPGGLRLLDQPLRDQRQDRINQTAFGYRYQYQLERVSAEMFWMIQRQLGDAAQHNELIQIFNSSGRLPIGGMSFIHVESRLQALKIQAIHTFPDDHVLVKTQSSFICAGASS